MWTMILDMERDLMGQPHEHWTQPATMKLHILHELRVALCLYRYLGQ